MKINVIRNGELKLHLNESAKKLGYRLFPLALIMITSNKINSYTNYFGVCITTTAIEKLEKREQFAILDHELGHIKWWKKDISFLFYVVSPVPFIVFLVFLNFKILPYTILFFIFFLIIRILKLEDIVKLKYNSEFMADETSAELGNAETLISAMRKIENHNQKQSASKIGNFLSWFYFSNCPSHPSTSERIKKLEKISDEVSFPESKIFVSILL